MASRRRIYASQSHHSRRQQGWEAISDESICESQVQSPIRGSDLHLTATCASPLTVLDQNIPVQSIVEWAEFTILVLNVHRCLTNFLIPQRNPFYFPNQSNFGTMDQTGWVFYFLNHQRFSGAEIGYGAKAQEVLGQVRRRVCFMQPTKVNCRLQASPPSTKHKKDNITLFIKTIFKLPAPVPKWPPGTSFASGIIDLGALHVSQATSFEKVWATYEGGLDNQGATFYEPSSIAEVLLELGRI
ncbi:hypothetical protein POM88_033757 [Heracleum sosnowskyi]|uniref:Uncharacterized protein n=1 Tax=Heracleum sosnowskyi TaxID=360622 RepID=A0AAD8M9Y0_9APIA|nr:hypothetical protein POM88_033757 [Heracleum sosnowskyi]